MKLFALQQSYANRRSNSFRSSSPLDLGSEGTGKSPAALFWLALHGLCCLISLVLGFRFSRLVFLSAVFELGEHEFLLCVAVFEDWERCRRNPNVVESGGEGWICDE
ncbi:unnamed protein product [Rhodiola kirilowii]